MKQKVCDENCAWNPSRCACEYGEYNENAVYKLILNDAAKKKGLLLVHTLKTFIVIH